eukprot:SAG22_NODE_1258_length_4983_cov_2.401925_6_plen_41_part_00
MTVCEDARNDGRGTAGWAKVEAELTMMESFSFVIMPGRWR